MYNYNCPDCNDAKLQSDKNARKINEVIDQLNALIQINNETVDFIEEKANEVVSELAEIMVNENISTKINMVSDDGTKWLLYIDNYGQIGVIKEVK